MKNPNYITNPKTIRKYEKAKKELDEMKAFAKDRGYITEKRSSLTWSFSKNGNKSVLGFDSEYEVLIFIFQNEPNADSIFPSYK